ncbi:MAG: acyltransferase [Bacteroidales bacterium]|jgi:hypothetical protein|nr:acyltransferase [Bacteroidales bacterium]
MKKKFRKFEFMEQSIPINILDILKYKLNQINASQYFFQFWTFKGDIDNSLLVNAFEHTCNNIPKCAYKLFENNGKFEYKVHKYLNTFVSVETDNSLVKEVENILKYKSKSIIKNSEDAPIIVVRITSNKDQTSAILLMVNHIMADASSGYIFFNTLVNVYNSLSKNEKFSTENVEHCTDDEYIKELYSAYSIKDKFNYIGQLLSHIKSSLYYKSDKNIITKIYSEQSSNDEVNYSYITIDKSDFGNFDYSKNTIFCAAIHKAFLDLKGENVNNIVSSAIPINTRSSKTNYFGNFVTSISIKTNAGMSFIETLDEVHSKTVAFKNRLRRIAAYKITTLLAKKNNGSQLLDFFRGLSSKHHFYISNFGDFNMLYPNTSYFSDCALQNTGGFNFPLQANYGLIFTLVPSGNKIGLSIAASSLVLPTEEIPLLQEKILEYVSGK